MEQLYGNEDDESIWICFDGCNLWFNIECTSLSRGKKSRIVFLQQLLVGLMTFAMKQFFLYFHRKIINRLCRYGLHCIKLWRTTKVLQQGHLPFLLD